MHVLHDDITGLFFAMVNYLENYSSKSADDLQSAPIDTDNRIIIVDEHASGDYKVFVNLLSDREAMHHGEFEPNTIVVFEEAMLGVSRRANWYQYGYGRPQGPIPNKVNKNENKNNNFSSTCFFNRAWTARTFG